MTQKGQRALMIALAVSVTVNLFVAGFVAAVVIRGPGLFFEHGPHMERLTQRLSPEGRELVHETFEHNRPAFIARMKNLRAARRAAAEALRADPFDAARLDAAFADMRQQTSGLQAAMQANVVDVAGKLSAEDRRQLANLPMMRMLVQDHPPGPPPPGKDAHVRPPVPPSGE